MVSLCSLIFSAVFCQQAPQAESHVLAFTSQLKTGGEKLSATIFCYFLVYTYMSQVCSLYASIA